MLAATASTVVFAVVCGGGAERPRLAPQRFQAQTPPLGRVPLRQLVNFNQCFNAISGSHSATALLAALISTISVHG